MQITLNIDEALLRQAKRLTGVQQHQELIAQALETLIQRRSAEMLARLSGHEALFNTAAEQYPTAP
ncbi:MAG: type II toxin-antitoxin system VapB family antitoxin [Phycisphaerae bacterium]|nr:type II toxin-antitoxin system VapB family antitoxin [Phycisphaerae bacterium]